MKTIGKEGSLKELKRIKDGFRDRIREGYEYKAKQCDSCETFGACCLDAHFVNVHITELEAAEINKVLEELPSVKRRAVRTRIDDAIDTFELTADGDTFSKTFACPLFERTSGCLVHTAGKPLACINHACYENREDLPPEALLQEAEKKIDRLNTKVLRRSPKWLPLPLAIRDWNDG